jgi:sn-glycerol 3-phosphate transport system permease protein
VTPGAPARATEILVCKVNPDGVEGRELGGRPASAIPMLIVIALTVLQFRYVERRVQYQ